MKEQIRKRFDEHVGSARLAEEHLTSRIVEAVELIVSVYKASGSVFVFGNGGSAADAQHIACELVGRFLIERRPLKAQALSTDPSILTSLSNDYGYDMVFSRQIEAQGRDGDVAIGITTSGNSANVVAGLAKARQLGMKTIAMTGCGGGQCAKLADVLLDVPSGDTPRIQEVHAVIYHVICEFVEAQLSEDA